MVRDSVRGIPAPGRAMLDPLSIEEASMLVRQVHTRNQDATDFLAVRETELPEPGPGEATVRIEAAGVSYGDLLQQRGVIPGTPKPPYVPGFDLVGKVERVGPGAGGVHTGQRVAALVRVGGYGEALNVPVERLLPVPDGVEPVSVAAASLNYFIAHQMLHRVARIERGGKILVHGASGGVGFAFLQLAALIGGVEVWGTASAMNADLLRAHGATPIDYRTEDFTRVVPRGIDAAFDPVGGRHFRASHSLLRRGGVMVGYGQNDVLRGDRKNMLVGAVGFLGGIVLPKLVPDGRRTMFYNAWSLEKAQPHAYREDLAAVLGLVARGLVGPKAVTVLPLADAAEAFAALREPGHGKLVLTP
ncbi:zinc-binding dehydrogenase [Actinokineospora enzanensis]|uniref:zinc-binding dehydrogenase n=1 Tax=Actinokineospora enzanensis TaxID=155975 RepID=UPI000372F3FF|nr:zinc-binding dehydrogenase [Actinokineospora enzanensis]